MVEVSSFAEKARKHTAEATGICKRGLADCGVLDLKTEDLQCVTLLVLARCVAVADSLGALYAVLDLLEEVGYLQLPSEAIFVERESDFQQRLVQAHSAKFVKAAADALKAHMEALQVAAKQRPRGLLTPLQLWQRQYAALTPPPCRKIKPPPTPPENAWQLLAPDRCPQGVPKAELSRCGGALRQHSHTHSHTHPASSHSPSSASSPPSSPTPHRALFPSTGCLRSGC